MTYSTSAHSTFYHRFHIVFVTKYRFKVPRGAMCERVREIIRQSCNKMSMHIVKGILAQDHVHMFLSVPPKLALSTVMQRIKGRADISRQPAEMSQTISYFSIENYILSVMLPTQVGSRLVNISRRQI